MCGIWTFLSQKDGIDVSQLFKSFQQIKNRGPDRSEFKQINEFYNFYLGFHRLAVMDNSPNGDQPFEYHENGRSVYCLCNGEIYNFKQIREKYKLKLETESDCEVIPKLYSIYGIEKLIQELVGEFVIIILDIDYQKEDFNLYAIRDPLGVRPMFYGGDEYSIGFCSEMKGLTDIVQHDKIRQFPPGYYMRLSKNSKQFVKYYNFDFPINSIPNFDPKTYDCKNELEIVKTSFINSVELMLEADRPLGALLSGGLDSSLVVSIASKYLKTHGKRLKTFSIGMPGATDKMYAELVSQFCDTDHTHIEFSNEDFINALEDIIWATETYDITTVRASTGQYLISKWIAQNTNIKVLLIGDGADELCAGYMYFHKAPDATQLHEENCKLLKEICYFDVLRADRGIAENGIEARVPFLNYQFVNLYMSIDPRLRGTIDGMEKWLLRKSFEGYLPNEVLYRRKEAFSDGVSSEENSWYQIVQKSLEEKYSDAEFKKLSSEYGYLAPPSKEALYYRQIFDKFFGKDSQQVIPHYWLPNWCGGVIEPSARILDVYDTKDKIGREKY